MTGTFAMTLRRLFAEDDRYHALRLVDAAEGRREHAARARVDRAAFEMKRLGRDGTRAVHLGTSLDSEGERFPVLLPEAEARGGGHWFVTGATGSGKSFWAIGVILQLLAKRRKNVIVVDMKGELAEALRRTWLPALLARAEDEDALDLAQRIAVVAPFDKEATPPFQVLARDPSIPIELQAREVASSFGATLGADLGILQQTILTYALLLAIDVGLTLPDVPHLLQDQSLLRGCLKKTSLPEVKAYFATRFPKERSGSLVSLLSRLDGLLMHPTLRDMLLAPGMIRFDRLLEDGVTVIDLGGAPAGMRELARFFGTILFQKLTRAIFARRVIEKTPPVTVVCDEFQELLTPELARDFERVLTLARSQRVFLWLLCQQTAQVEAASPVLLRILKTNVNYKLLFRAELEDARALAHILPVSGRVPKERQGFVDPRTPPVFLTADEERRQLVEHVPRMPDRIAWFWNRRRPYGAVLLRSPDLDVQRAEEDALALPDELRQHVARGVLALEREELAAARRERGARRITLAEGRVERAVDDGANGGNREAPVDARVAADAANAPTPVPNDTVDAAPDATGSSPAEASANTPRPPRGRRRARLG